MYKEMEKLNWHRDIMDEGHFDAPIKDIHENANDPYDLIQADVNISYDKKEVTISIMYESGDSGLFIHRKKTRTPPTARDDNKKLAEYITQQVIKHYEETKNDEV